MAGGAREPALILFLLVLFQACLGTLTVVMRKGVEVTTAHVAVGALVVAESVYLSVRTFQLYRVAGGAEIEELVRRTRTGIAPPEQAVNTNGRNYGNA